MSFISYLELGGCLLAASLAMSAAPRSQALSCQVGTPSAESYTWNFQAEAQALLETVVSDAREVQDHADHLHGMMLEPEISWQSHALELSQIRDEVNDLGQKLCRLETIRRVTSPWERKAIDQAAPLISELAHDTQNAITILNANHEYLFMPDYTSLGADLYHNSSNLVNSVTEFETFGKVHQEDIRLEKSLGFSKRS
jgi:hypothetical protein